MCVCVCVCVCVCLPAAFAKKKETGQLRLKREDQPLGSLSLPLLSPGPSFLSTKKDLRILRVLESSRNDNQTVEFIVSGTLKSEIPAVLRSALCKRATCKCKWRDFQLSGMPWNDCPVDWEWILFAFKWQSPHDDYVAPMKKTTVTRAATKIDSSRQTEMSKSTCNCKRSYKL